MPPKQSLRKFFNFINERHLIFVRRARGEDWPWTSDPILQKYRFTNVFRELDRVTVWIRENWREPYADHPNLWFAMAMARQINWPDTLAEIGFPEKWQPRRVMNVIQHRRVQGLKAYTSAYMLTGGWKGSKAKWTVFGILDPLYIHPPLLDKAATLKDAFNMFKGRPGFGPFLSYEVVTDLRHTRYLRFAPDIMKWANAGPGAIRGLHRVWGRPLKLKGLKRKRLVEVPHYGAAQALEVVHAAANHVCLGPMLTLTLDPPLRHERCHLGINEIKTIKLVGPKTPLEVFLDLRYAIQQQGSGGSGLGLVAGLHT